ncbi:phosphoribosyltransferase-like protein [Streptomyces pseudovenezuelae]|uniref:phosphoribosyltransferase-like protein n=1 Tax=Streptomyces pseudovenezuelae TaxID=67350 RepID=UPI0037159B2E
MTYPPDTPGLRPRPSQTPQGEAWLANFRPDDALLAQQVLDSLHFFSSTTFRQGLTELLHSVLTSTGPSDQPAALYSVHSSRESSTMFMGDREPLVPRTGGSELIVQNIVRATELAFDNAVVSRGTSSLELLKGRRVRRLVFVSDYAGSGDESLGYVRSWLRNPTVRSWRSLKLVQIHLVLFAASPTALKRLNGSPYYDGVHVLHCGMDFSAADWDQSERDRIREVCSTYAHSKGGAHGWGGSEGLVVFEHTIPNNLPMIVRQTKGPPPYGTWEPFFRNRTAPRELMQLLADYRPDFDRLRQLRSVRQSRLAAASQLRTMERPVLEQIIDVLAHIAGRRRNPAQLAVALGMSVPGAVEITARACRLGLLDEQVRLTDAGWHELRRAKATPRRVASGLQGSTDPYYPRQLKGSR